MRQKPPAASASPDETIETNNPVLQQFQKTTLSQLYQPKVGNAAGSAIAQDSIKTLSTIAQQSDQLKQQDRPTTSLDKHH